MELTKLRLALPGDGVQLRAQRAGWDATRRVATGEGLVLEGEALRIEGDRFELSRDGTLLRAWRVAIVVGADRVLLLAGVAGPSAVRATTAATPLPRAVRPVVGRGARGEAGAGLALQLHADRLVLRPEAGCTLGQACASELELAGAVSVGSAGLQLRAGRVAVSLDARGRPYRVRAVEGVVVQFGARSGRADELVLLAHPRRVTLRGNARLECAEQGLALRGSWIEVDLENGAVVVQRAEVALP